MADLLGSSVSGAASEPHKPAPEDSEEPKPSGIAEVATDRSSQDITLSAPGEGIEKVINKSPEPSGSAVAAATQVSTATNTAGQLAFAHPESTPQSVLSDYLQEDASSCPSPVDLGRAEWISAAGRKITAIRVGKSARYTDNGCLIGTGKQTTLKAITNPANRPQPIRRTTRRLRAPSMAPIDDLNEPLQPIPPTAPALDAVPEEAQESEKSAAAATDVPGIDGTCGDLAEVDAAE